jgi:peptidoglycan/xylan/chitin deacetylase (PgdA/CDA1 family)
LTVARRFLSQAVALTAAPLARALTAKKPRLVMFHRFSQGASFRRMSMDDFEWHIRYLQRHYHIVSLREIVRCLRAREPLPQRAVGITFDDGHRDFLDLAYPLLVRLRVPATLYLVSDFVSQQLWLWSDAIHYLVRQAPAGRYQVAVGTEVIEAVIDDMATRDAAWERIADRCLPLSSRAREGAIATLAQELGVALPAVPSDDYAAMNWNDLRGIDPALVEVGAHTRTHPILSRCDSPEQESEISQCQATIENEMQRDVTAFCFPNGRREDFNDTTLDILRRSRFTSAAASYSGIISPDTHPFMLPRIGASGDRTNFRMRIDRIDQR